LAQLLVEQHHLKLESVQTAAAAAAQQDNMTVNTGLQHRLGMNT
jgi:hypothetical protein